MVKVGDRIKVLDIKDDPSWNKTIFKGDEGTVIDIEYIELFKETQIWVEFDNGSQLALLDSADRFEII